MVHFSFFSFPTLGHWFYSHILHISQHPRELSHDNYYLLFLFSLNKFQHSLFFFFLTEILLITVKPLLFANNLLRSFATIFSKAFALHHHHRTSVFLLCPTRSPAASPQLSNARCFLPVFSTCSSLNSIIHTLEVGGSSWHISRFYILPTAALPQPITSGLYYFCAI